VLKNHRRTLVHALGLLAAVAIVFAIVGRHEPREAPRTEAPIVGRWDLAVNGAMDDVRNVIFTGTARALNVIGRGVVTIPLRGVISLWLALRRRWRGFATWVLTWGLAEATLWSSKAYFHRGRPPDPLVATSSYSLPSGHAVAGAATTLALVLVLLPSGSGRRKWEAAAVAFTLVMAASRVYLNAHWLSDVVAGVLLGWAVALGSAALVSEVLHRLQSRGGPSRAGPSPIAGPGP